MKEARYELYYSSGKAILSLIFDIENPGWKLRISGLYVEPEYRRMGIAKKILQIACEKFPNVKVVAEVARNNRESVLLFHYCGFEIEKVTEHYLFFKKGDGNGFVY